MPTPKELLKIGLDKHEAGNDPTKTRLAALAAAPGNPARLKLTLHNIAKARKSLIELRDSTAIDLADFKKLAKEKWDAFGWVENDSGIGRIDQIGPTTRKKYLDADVLKFVKAQREENEEARSALAATIRENRESLALVADYFSSPLTHLMLTTITSTERATLTANLASANPIELNRAVQLAVMSRDAPLASAICARFDTLNREERKSVNFSKNGLALQIAGPEWSRNAEVLAVANYLADQAVLADKELCGKKVAATDKIGAGVRLANVEARIGRKFLDERGEVLMDTSITLEETLDAKYPSGPLPSGYQNFGEGGTNE